MMVLFTLFMLGLLFSCGGGSSNSHQEQKLGPRITWYIQLQGELKLRKDVELCDVDLFDTPKEVIKKLKASGKKVVCYFNAGAYEDWRPDKDRFPAEVLGKPLEGWEGERWLDIRKSRVREIMVDRLKLARDKGCDGVDPDNVNGYQNDTGFDITYADQLEYNRFLAREAHKLGLMVGLKNDGEQVKDLVESFDFSVQEECHEYRECELYYPFIKEGKPVFNIEYSSEYLTDSGRRRLCSEAEKEGFMTAVYNIELDGTTFLPCWEITSQPPYRG